VATTTREKNLLDVLEVACLLSKKSEHRKEFIYPGKEGGKRRPCGTSEKREKGRREKALMVASAFREKSTAKF